jgi:Zn-dependent protease with chaperone function
MIELLGACANVIVPEASPEAMSYYNSGNLLWIVNQAWSFIVPLLFLFTGFSGRLGAFAQKVGKNWFLTVLTYLVVYVVLNQIFDLPLAYYAGFAREHAYGLSTQTFSGWVNNWLIGSAISLVFTLAFVWIFFLLLKKSPKKWWMYSSIVAVAIVFFLSFIQPVWIDPLFNKFGPMNNKELEGDILSLASRAGIEDGRVYEVDKSAETKTLNAYVVGFGKTNRIVLWDTTIARMSTNEILFVMGHEMGHYVLHHMWWGLAFFACVITAVLYLTSKSVGYLFRIYKKKFGFEHLYNIASLPLFILVINFFTFFTAPIDNYLSRTLEHNADTFGLEITRDNQAAGDAFVVLQQDNLANPRPGLLYKIWRCSHPPLAERVEFCNTYCPWAEGKPLKYGKFFEQAGK